MTRRCLFMYFYLSLSLSLYIYIYMFIYLFIYFYFYFCFNSEALERFLLPSDYCVVLGKTMRKSCTCSSLFVSTTTTTTSISSNSFTQKRCNHSIHRKLYYSRCATRRSAFQVGKPLWFLRLKLIVCVCVCLFCLPCRLGSWFLQQYWKKSKM